MCQKCLDAVNRHYPNLQEPEIVALLMGATCYPVGDAQQVEENLVELKKNTDGTLGSALAYADSQLEIVLLESESHEN